MPAASPAPIISPGDPDFDPTWNAGQPYSKELVVSGGSNDNGKLPIVQVAQGGPAKPTRHDLDIVARTLIGEGPPEQWPAIGHVIRNRAMSDGYPASAAEVALQRGQFEPWQTRRRELMGISPNSDAYKQAYEVAKGVMSGTVTDPTGGATMFWAPEAQMRAGRAPPAWSAGRQDGVHIGNQVFYPPKTGPAVPDYAGAYLQGGDQPQGASPVPAQAAGGTAEVIPDYASSYMTTPAHEIAGVNPPTVAEAAQAAVKGGTGMNTAAATGAGFLGGVPLVGPALSDAAARVGGGLISYGQGVPFPQAYEASRALLSANAAEHPVATTAGHIGGAIAGTAPLIAAAPAAFGIGAASVPVRAGVSALTNSALGGADAYMRDGNATDIARSALIGGAFGAGGPVIGNALGGLVRGVLPGASTAAERSMMDALTGLDPAAYTYMAQRLRANPRLTPMDVSDELRGRAMGIATQPGEGQNVLRRFVNEREATAADAVSGGYDAALGATPDVKATLDGMKATAAANAAKGFGAALQGAAPVDTSAVLQTIDKKLTPGLGKGGIAPSATDSELLRIRARLAGEDGKTFLTNADDLHELQSMLREDANAYSKSSVGSERRIGKAVRDVRSDLVDAIDKATGGKFKPAQRQYADDIAIQEAFDKGTGIMGNAPKALENRPEFWKDWVANATPAELAAAKLGARTAFDQKLGAVRNPSRTGSTLTDAELNTGRLKHLLGQSETEQLEQVMRAAQDEYATNQALFKNSLTSPREKAAAAVKVRDVGAPPISALTQAMMSGVLGHWASGSPLIGIATGVGLPLAQRAWQALGRRADMARNLGVSKALSTPGQAGADVIDRLSALSRGTGIDPRTWPSALLPGAGQTTEQRYLER